MTPARLGTRMVRNPTWRVVAVIFLLFTAGSVALAVVSATLTHRPENVVFGAFGAVIFGFFTYRATTAGIWITPQAVTAISESQHLRIRWSRIRGFHSSGRHRTFGHIAVEYADGTFRRLVASSSAIRTEQIDTTVADLNTLLRRYNLAAEPENPAYDRYDPSMLTVTRRDVTQGWALTGFCVVLTVVSFALDRGAAAGPALAATATSAFYTYRTSRQLRRQHRTTSTSE